MGSRKAAAISLCAIGLLLLPLGPIVNSKVPPALDGIGFIIVLMGIGLLMGALVQWRGRDIVLWPFPAVPISFRCLIAGVAFIAMSLFPLGLAIRDADFRVIGVATFVGAVIIGVAFVVVGVRLGRPRS